MPLNVATGVTCPIPLLGARGLELTFPGGAKIGAMMSQLYATEAEVARSLLAQVQLVLAPTKPIFDILAAVLAIVKILDAVATLNPVKIAKEISNAAKTFASLAQLVPQISGPLMVAHVLDVVIRVLEGFMVELAQIALKEQDIDRLAQQIISESDPLAAVLDCARKINAMRMCAVDEAMAPLSPIFELLNLFLALLGVAPLQPLGPLGHDVFGARTQVQKLIDLLRGVRRGLPIPPLNAQPRC